MTSIRIFNFFLLMVLVNSQVSSVTKHDAYSLFGAALAQESATPSLNPSGFRKHEAAPLSSNGESAILAHMFEENSLKQHVYKAKNPNASEERFMKLLKATELLEEERRTKQEVEKRMKLENKLRDASKASSLGQDNIFKLFQAAVEEEVSSPSKNPSGVANTQEAAPLSSKGKSAILPHMFEMENLEDSQVYKVRNPDAGQKRFNDLMEATAALQAEREQMKRT